MPGVRSPYKGLPPKEAKKQKGRVARAIAHGVTLEAASKRFGMTNDRIKEICAEFKIETPKPSTRR